MCAPPHMPVVTIATESMAFREALQPAAEWEAAHAMEAELMRVRRGGGHDRTRGTAACRSARRKERSSKVQA
ncbi:hypothetical protein ACP70R_003615 [Stipagrostis hirtigluma subsp. patula]